MTVVLSKTVNVPSVSPLVEQSQLEQASAPKVARAQSPDTKVIMATAESANTQALTEKGLRQPKVQPDQAALPAQFSTMLQSFRQPTAETATHTQSANEREKFSIITIDNGFSGKKADIYNMLIATVQEIQAMEGSQQASTAILARSSAELSGEHTVEAAKQGFKQALTSAVVGFGVSGIGAGVSINSLSKQNTSLLDSINSQTPAQGLTHQIAMNDAMKIQQIGNVTQQNSVTLGNLSGQGYAISQAEKQGESRLDDNNSQTLDNLAQAKQRNKEMAHELLKEILRLAEDDNNNRNQTASAVISGIRG